MARTDVAAVRGRAIGSTVLLLASTLGLACTADRPTNLLLVTVDTLRADHTGPGGYGRATTPHLDAFAEDAVVFARATASSSWTLPSVATLMTSLHSSTHRCWGYASSLDGSYETLSEILRTSGYRTAMVTNQTILAERHGLQQGFDFVDDELVPSSTVAVHRTISSPEITSRSLDWLRRHDPGAGPFFLWVHYFDPHDEYLRHPGVSDRFGEEAPLDLYDGEIRFTDEAFGELLDGLDALGLSDDTLVVMTSDHGEEFGEHGGYKHGHTLHRELLDVPLVIRAPGFAARRVDARVGLIDVMPTVLDLLGLPPGDEAEGRSLVAAMRGRPDPHLESRTMLFELRLFLAGHAFGVIEGDLKLIFDPKTKDTQLFDLRTDPHEQRDLSSERPEDVTRLLASLRKLRSAALDKAGGYDKAPRLDLSADIRENLRLLGYLKDDEEGAGGAAPEQTAQSPARPAE